MAVEEIVIAEMVVDGVRYQLRVDRVDPKVLGQTELVWQMPRVKATLA